MRTPFLLPAALVALTVACGARSPLGTSTGSAAGAGGSGPGTTGAGGEGTSTGSSASAGGGVNVVCPALAMPEPLVELPALSDLRAAHDPLLQGLGPSGVLALMRRETLKPPSELSSVSEVRLAPWESWPPTFEASLLVLSDSWNVPFVSSVEPLGTVALGVEPVPKNNPSGCDLAALYGLSPEAPPGPSALALQLAGTCNDAPLAIATAGNGLHFVANDVQHGTSIQTVRSLVAHVLDASGNMLASPEPLCAWNSFVGDVLADETGFLFVHSSSDSPSCADTAPDSLGRRLLLRRSNGKEETSTLLYEGMDDLVYARILPRKGGSWVFYRESGSSALIQPPGMALRLEKDSPSGEAFPVTPPGTDRMASAAFGDGFVVAYVESIDPSAPQIFVRVYDGSGALVSEASFDTNGAWLLGDRLTLVASPSAMSFLVGWVGTSDKAGPEMFVRRFDCIPHE